MSETTQSTRRCPDCINGIDPHRGYCTLNAYGMPNSKSYSCPTCRGSGWVKIVPAERPTDLGTQLNLANHLNASPEPDHDRPQ